MNVLIKYISAFDRSGQFSIDSFWRKDPDYAFTRLPVLDAARFLVQQSIAAHYINLVYGKNPILVEEFRVGRLASWHRYLSTVFSRGELAPGVAEAVKYALIAADFFIGNNPSNYGQLNVDRILTYTRQIDSTSEMPIATHNQFYEWYVRYAITASLYNPLTFKGFLEEHRFTVLNVVVPHVIYSEDLICLSEVTFPSYTFAPDRLNRVWKARFGIANPDAFVRSCFGVFLGLDFQQTSLSAVLAFLGGFALERDLNKYSEYGYLSLDPLYSAIDQMVRKHFVYPDYRRSELHHTFEQKMYLQTFIIYMKTWNHIQFDDLQLLLSILDVSPNELEAPAKFLIAYLDDIGEADEEEVFQALKFGRVNPNEKMVSVSPAFEADENNDDFGSEGPDNEEDDNSNPESGDAGEDDPDDDNQNSVDASSPVKPPTTNDRDGVNIFLKEGDSFENVLTRLECANLIDRILADNTGRFAPGDRKILEKVKLYVINLISIKTLIEIITKITKRNKK